ncbi:Hypothetical predicted protein [Octopus vulgaris]|uniref:Uncharacterized protein n=1 Tax=Octopus vulgaris TaxID=6645 RepID=A0AA36EZ39_OCTVU|nr:Hypothetical predicted protein [Octopus vulgaris]
MHFEELYRVDPSSSDHNTTTPSALMTNKPVNCDLLPKLEVHTVGNQVKSRNAAGACGIRGGMIKKDGLQQLGCYYALTPHVKYEENPEVHNSKRSIYFQPSINNVSTDLHN